MSTATSEPTTESAGGSPLQGLFTLWSIVRRHKLVVMCGLMIGLIVGGLAYLQAAPVYQSSCQVLVIQKRPDVVMQNPAEPQSMYTQDYLATHTVLIQSEKVLSLAARRLDTGSLALPPAGGNPVGLLRAGLTVSREKDTSGPTNILSISIRSASPADSARLLNAVVEGYRDFLTETYGSMNDETYELIKKAQDLLQKDLAKKQEAYQAICLRNPVALKAKDGVHSFQDRIHQIEDRMAKLEVRQKEIETRLAVIAKGRKDGLSPATILATLRDPYGCPTAKPGDEPAHALETSLLEMRLKYEELTEALGSNHPQVKALQRRIDIVREQLARVKATDQGKPVPDPLDILVQSLKVEYEENRLLLAALAPELKNERTRAEELAKYLIEEEQARAEVARLRQLCDGIIDRLRQINLAREAGGYDARVVTQPAPGQKVAPLAVTYAILALVGGLALGLGLGYLVDFNDRSFRTPLEIKQRLGLPVIGHIPHLVAVPADTADTTQAAAQLVAYHRPKSPESEAFRGVRTSLYFSTRGTGHQVIQITSPGMGDGKSTLAANLAVSIAQSGKRTVLIDADFRRPAAHKLFPALRRDCGLASVIAGDARLEEAIQSTVVANLSVMPCGPRPANPAELLTSPRFEELLDEFRSRYDMVLVDTPPVLMVSDPCAVAPRVDGVLLVVRQAKNNRPGAERAVELLGSLGATVLGVMVNDKAINSGDKYGYGYRYSYQYGYGYGYQAAYVETEDGTARVGAKAEPPTNGFHGPDGAT